ncbi:MAG: transporter substrate-binding domain-containing protein [Spartobacteria bacterium]|nr:transporter substrate-binding domain-containing protein [Spartobacteria bacterium]
MVCVISPFFFMRPRPSGGSGHAPNRPKGTLRLVLNPHPPIRYLPHMKTLFKTSISGRVPTLPKKRFLINKSLSHLLLCVVFLTRSLPVSAQNTLILSAVEKTPPANTVTEVLRQAYQQLGIELEILELPGLRGIAYSNNGDTDGEAFRIAGIDQEYSNLIQIDVPIRTDAMHLFVKQGREFPVTGWDCIPKEYLLGYKRGVKHIEYAVAKYGLRAEAVNSVEQLFQKLETGRNDVIVTGVQEGAQLIPQLHLQDIIRLEPSVCTSSLYHYLHEKHADLVPKITAVLKEMEAHGEIQTIRE